MTKASDNAFPSVLITEGTEPAAPAASHQRLYIDSTSHHLSRTDSAGAQVDLETNQSAGAMATDTLWDAAGDLAVGTGANAGHKLTAGAAGTFLVSGGAADPVWTTMPHDEKRYTGGDITLTGTSMTAVTGPTDLVVAAAAGDLLMVGVSVRCPNTTAQSVSFDFATIVSAAPVNYIGTRSGTPANIPVGMWFIGSGEASGCGGAWPYVVQAGDISGGNVTLRLYSRVSGNRVVSAGTAGATALDTWVKNLR